MAEDKKKCAPELAPRHQNMERFCADLLEQVRAGKVGQLFAIVETGTPSTAPALLYMNCDESGKRTFMENVCGCVSHMVDTAVLTPLATPNLSENRLH